VFGLEVKEPILRAIDAKRIQECRMADLERGFLRDIRQFDKNNNSVIGLLLFDDILDVAQRVGLAGSPIAVQDHLGWVAGAKGTPQSALKVLVNLVSREEQAPVAIRFDAEVTVFILEPEPGLHGFHSWLFLPVASRSNLRLADQLTVR